MKLSLVSKAISKEIFLWSSFCFYNLSILLIFQGKICSGRNWCDCKQPARYSVKDDTRDHQPTTTIRLCYAPSVSRCDCKFLTVKYLTIVIGWTGWSTAFMRILFMSQRQYFVYITENEENKENSLYFIHFQWKC